jgi:hypothetical protein
LKGTFVDNTDIVIAVCDIYLDGRVVKDEEVIPGITEENIVTANCVLLKLGMFYYVV